jgi:hypothetical protein
MPIMKSLRGFKIKFLDVTKFSKLLVMLKQLEMTIHQDLEN